MDLFLLRVLLLFDKFSAWFKALTLKKIMVLGGRTIAALVSLLVLLVFLIWTGLLGSMPNKKELQAVQNPTASEVYSADSVLLGRYFIQERSNITFQEIPAHTIQALIATEVVDQSIGTVGDVVDTRIKQALTRLGYGKKTVK